MPQATCVEICLEEPRKLFLPRGIKIKMGPLFKMHRKWNKWINIFISRFLSIKKKKTNKLNACFSKKIIYVLLLHFKISNRLITRHSRLACCSDMVTFQFHIASWIVHMCNTSTNNVDNLAFSPLLEECKLNPWTSTWASNSLHVLLSWQRNT